MKALQIIVGILLLFPGLCGTFFFAGSLLGQGTSAEARAYGSVFSAIAVPSIQLGCLGMWLLARHSTSKALRTFTRLAGAFGALAAASLLFFVFKLSSDGSLSNTDWLVTIGSFTALAIIPFLIGGLPALLLKPEPEGRLEP
jgi:Kef-type K+ transport system membrane component KefB